MKRLLNITSTLTMVVYFGVIILTPFSFTGFWTDVVFAIAIVIFSILNLRRVDIKSKIVKIIHRYTTIGIAIIVIGVIGIHVINPFLWTVYKTKIVDTKIDESFVEIEYFRPTGAWGCGYGAYWKTKTFKYFPIIEFETYKDNCTHDDWGYYMITGKFE